MIVQRAERDLAERWGRCLHSALMVEPLAPEGTASRRDFEAVRFIGWDLTGVTLRELDFSACAFVRCRRARADFSFCDARGLFVLRYD